MEFKRPKIFQGLSKTNQTEVLVNHPFIIPLLEQFEPKRNNRWIVTLPDQWEIPSYLVNRITKPKAYCNVETENLDWDIMKITILDPINPSTTQKINRIFYEYQFNTDWVLVLEHLDPTGISVEKWSIAAKIIGCDFGDLDYSSEGISTNCLYLQPTNCILEY